MPGPRRGGACHDVRVSSSLKDVAARAGVSARTVSNVVNGSARVAPETRRRVQEAIEELGYRPNLAARSLRAGRTGIIGLAIPELHSPTSPSSPGCWWTRRAGDRGRWSSTRRGATPRRNGGC